MPHPSRKASFRSLPMKALHLLRHHYARLMALGAYGYQALAALLLLFALGWVLPPEEYTAYSLSVATGQFAAIGAFEWVRLAATRFYPGPDPNRSNTQQSSVLAGFVCSAGLLVSLSLIALVFLPTGLVCAAVALALCQGATDLHLTLCRFRGGLKLFSSLQAARATLLLVGAISGSVLTRTATGGLWGMAAGYLVVLAAGIVIDRVLRAARVRDVDMPVMRSQATYGFPAAGASVMYLGSMMLFRYAVNLLLPAGLAPGVLMAIDVMQRPFYVVLTALNGILYPPVVAAYDQGGMAHARKSLGNLIKIQVAVLTLIGVLLVVVTVPASLIIVPEKMREGFIFGAFYTMVIFFLRSILIGIMSLPAHLSKQMKLVFFLSMIDLFAMAVLLFTFYISNISKPHIIMSIPVLTSLFMIILCFLLQRSQFLSREALQAHPQQ